MTALTLFDVPAVHRDQAERVVCPGCGHRFAPTAVWVSQGRPACFGCVPRDGIAAARLARDEAMVRVETNAGDEWRTEAWAWLRGYLETHASFFADDVWDAGCPVPHDRRAFGPLVQRAKREGLIVATGEWRPRSRGHASVAMVYRSVVYRKGAA